MDKLKKALGGESSEDKNSVFTDISDATKLSWSTRIKGFIICFVLGFVVSFLGSCLLFLSDKGLMLFAIFYTLGNLLSISSTCFLMGPCNQIKKMFEKTRLIATIVVFVCMALTLCAALWWKIAPLALVFCIAQFLALTWYSLSYIPFARDAAKKIFSGCIG